MPADYLEPYRRSAALHGPGRFDVTLWASPRSQRLRFEVFTQMAFFAGKRVLDAGCGRGDFAAFLHETGIGYERYVGVDGLAEVIAHAGGRGLPRCEFVAGDFVVNPKLLATGQPQIVCISGALNTMADAMATQVLEAAWAAAGEALLFNFLSDRSSRNAPPQDDGPARRLDTMNLIDWALTQTSQVAFRQDYFSQGHDATILMRKLGVPLRGDR